MCSLGASPVRAGTLGPGNPFPGLRPYQEGDADWFFGRGREINELLKRLRRVRFLAVVGPSGSGKSSLIKAGVLAGLRDGYLDAEWRIVSLCPGEKPLDNLAGELGDPATVRKTLDRGSMGLVEAIQEQRLPAGNNILILIDQFEELFQFVERRGEAAREEAKAFLKLLLSAAACDDAPIYVVITMRLEWLNECATYTGLAEAINEGIYLVPQMTRRQFQQCILGPIEAASGTITSALLDRMLNDLDSRMDQLPVLQHALLRIWQKRKPGEPLGIQNYTDAGTFTNCLSNHAREVFDEFSLEQQKTAEGLFRSITQVFKNRKVRRPRPLGEIAAETGRPLDQLKAVVEAFRQEGRSFLVATPGPLKEGSIIDISHEALIRQWDLLEKWVDDEAVTQSRIARLEGVAAEWSNEQRKYVGALYRGVVLQQAEELKPRLKPHSAAMAFLRTSRRAQRARGIVTLGGIAMVIVAGIAVLMSWEREKTQDAQQQAREAANEAAKVRALAELQAKRDEDYKHEVADLVQQFQTAPPNAPLASMRALQASIERVQGKRVYEQYVGPQQLALARLLQVNLAHHGYTVPGYEDVSAKTKPQTETRVKYFHDSDKDDAEKLVSLLRLTVSGPIVAQATTDTKSLVPAGQFEIWLAANATPVQNSAASPEK